MKFHVSLSPSEKAEQFLKVASQFSLGELATESSHPKTRDLSYLAQNNLHKAVELLREVDLDALEMMAAKLPQIAVLGSEVAKVLGRDGRIFLCGCGATGRLSLSLEYIWRRHHMGTDLEDKVHSFMAGGDTALVHALEGFEDYPAYGARQLREAGFRPGDLLVSCTEGGETPFVIGATEAAAQEQGPAPFFLYCNPDEILRNKVERSRLVLENHRIRKVNLYVGPMALAGSTRMQASTVLMLAVGLALFFPQSERMKSAFVDYRDHYATIDLQAQPQFIEAESKVYQDGGHLLYHAEELAIAVFTDTTERAPTFSLSPFDNQKFPRSRHSLSYVIIDSAGSSRESWHRLLARPARPLNWGPEYPQTNEDYMEGFDFGQGGADYRRQAIPGAHEDFTILKSGQEIVWSFKGLEARFPSDLDHELFDHLLLKQLLNIHSTLIMGRLNRYQMNFMTWVVPTNGKLVDRASRYVSWLLEDSGMGSVNYEDIVRELFVQQEKLQPQESVVLKTFEALKEILK